jgi:hypothetical protein
MIIQFSNDLKNLMKWKEPWFKLKQQSLMGVSLGKLSKGKYVSTIVMLKMTFFAIGLNATCVRIIGL